MSVFFFIILVFVAIIMGVAGAFMVRVGLEEKRKPNPFYWFIPVICGVGEFICAAVTFVCAFAFLTL